VPSQRYRPGEDDSKGLCDTGRYADSRCPVDAADELRSKCGKRSGSSRYELTFITPKGVDISGQSPGTDQIVIETRSLVVGDAFVEVSGLGTLATNARNTLQHAEAWSGDDVFNTFKSASEAEGVDMNSSPTVVSRPNQPFKVEMVDSEGKGYLLSGEADFLPDGSFAVKARAERRE